MNKPKQPLEVRQGRFPVNKTDQVLYSDHDYALAISDFDKRGYQCIGIRWQHEGIHTKGYPKGYFGHPQWMMLPKELAIPILSHIINTKKEDENENEVNYERIANAIKEISNT